MPATLDALVPVKGFGEAKERLAPLLRPAERRTLARVMFEDVLAALAGCRPLERIWVLTGDDEVEALARRQAARVIREPASTGGLNQSLEFGRGVILEETAEPVAGLLVIHADLPYLTGKALGSFLECPLPAPCVRLCSADDGGTNALLLQPGPLIPFAYGRGSASLHRLAAAAAGAACEDRRVPGLIEDMDTPDDVERALRSSRESRASRLLQSWGVAERLRL